MSCLTLARLYGGGGDGGGRCGRGGRRYTARVLVRRRGVVYLVFTWCSSGHQAARGTALLNGPLAGHHREEGKPIRGPRRQREDKPSAIPHGIQPGEEEQRVRRLNTYQAE